MIDDVQQRQRTLVPRARIPGNSYRQISIVDPPAPRGKKATEPSKEIESVDSTFYSLRAPRLCASLFLSLSLLYPLVRFINVHLSRR